MKPYHPMCLKILLRRGYDNPVQHPIIGSKRLDRSRTTLCPPGVNTGCPIYGKLNECYPSNVKALPQTTSMPSILYTYPPAAEILSTDDLWKGPNSCNIKRGLGIQDAGMLSALFIFIAAARFGPFPPHSSFAACNTKLSNAKFSLTHEI